MEEDIIKMYLDGVGSSTIAKKLGVSKPIVLKILHKHSLIVKKENPLYETFGYDGDKWFTHYTCSQCREKIKIRASKKYYLARNLKRKSICKPCSLENQKGVGNPFYGKTHSDVSKALISEKRKGIRTSYHMDKQEYKDSLSKMKRDLWSSGKMEGVRRKMSELMKTRIRNGELKSYNRSKAEFEIIEILSNKGINTIDNFKIDTKIYDIYVPEFNLLIEYNGDYWHCNPIKYSADYYNKKKDKTAKEIWDYDENKLYLAKNNGYNYEVIWEYDYKRNKDIISELITKYEKND